MKIDFAGIFGIQSGLARLNTEDELVAAHPQGVVGKIAQRGGQIFWSNDNTAVAFEAGAALATGQNALPNGSVLQPLGVAGKQEMAQPTGEVLRTVFQPQAAAGQQRQDKAGQSQGDEPAQQAAGPRMCRGLRMGTLGMHGLRHIGILRMYGLWQLGIVHGCGPGKPGEGRDTPK